jgi:hypothetical protein
LTLDFQLSASALSPASVAPGSAATATVALAPLGGFNGNVSLSCSGLPSGASCSFAPASVAGEATSTVTLQTKAASALALPARWQDLRDGRRGTPVLVAAVTVLLALIVSLLRGPQRLRWAPLVVAVLFCVGLTLTSCGGGSGGSAGGGSGGGGGGGGSGGGGNQGTPAGSYTIVVSASSTSGSTTLTHTTNLTLVVQ